MSSRKRGPVPAMPPGLALQDRKLRFSHRFNTWQFTDRVTGAWRNTTPEMARCYVAAGFGVDIVSTEIGDHQRQGELV